MKTVVYWLGTLLILSVMAFEVHHKEQVLASGQTVLLRLAPVNPLSLMRGGYMLLRYRIARELNADSVPDSGRIVIELNSENIGRYVRVDDGSKLAPGQHLLSYKKRGETRLGAKSFFFQEGEGQKFRQAAFGELKVDTDGKSVLIGLRDVDLKKL